LAFSQCDKDMCDSSSSPHFSSLIFFNYPNSSDINFDINKTIQNDVVLNFEKSLVIENNIFGYEFKGTKILNDSNGIILLKNGNNLEIGTIIDSGENIQFKFRMDDFYLKGNYIIEFVYVLTEPDYEKFNHKAENIYQIYGNDKEDEEEYFTKNEYTGKTSNFIVTISQNLQTECQEVFCSLCYSNNAKKCISCLYDYYFNEDTKSKICINNASNILSYFNNEKFVGNINITLSNAQLKLIYKILKSRIKENTSQIIETENVIFQISPLSEQKNKENPNISYIDLGECINFVNIENFCKTSPIPNPHLKTNYI